MTLAYERFRDVLPYAGVVLANNPGSMTLEGTNTWLLRDSVSRRAAIVVDPGPDDQAHLDAVLDAAGSVRLILLTHGHFDHSAGARRFHDMTGAPVLALDPAHRFGAEGLVAGEIVSGAGVEVEVLATPGHSSDSLSFVVPAGGESQAVLTGDTILGRGTTVVAHPDGVLADYLTTLRRLALLDGVAVLPGHGPELPDAGSAARMYLAHREQRLDQVRAALAAGGDDMTARQVVEVVYADVDEGLWWAAEMSVRAQLDYLRR